MAAHDRLIKALNPLYGDDLYTHAGATYPLRVLRPADGQTDVNSLLVGDFPRDFVDPAAFPARDDAHLQGRQATRTLTNGLCYVMDHIETAPLQIRAKLGYYFDMIATCDAFDHELRDFARGDRDDTPLREAFHAAVPPGNAVYNGRGRAAVIGGAVLTVFNHADGYQCLIGQRPAQMATGAGLYHVVPAFVFQPSGPERFYAGEWSFTHHVLREFGEELFAMPEFHTWKSALAHDYFYSHPAVGDLRAMLTQGDAQLQLTGVACNLLSLRPEICALLIIHDDGWYTRWQHELTAAQHTERQETRHIPLDTLADLPDDLHLRMAPQGAAAFWLGVERARVLVTERG